jgi:hypothetical protein
MLYGVWNGKTGKHWQNEQIDVASRSPKLKHRLERNMAIAGRIRSNTDIIIHYTSRDLVDDRAGDVGVFSAPAIGGGARWLAASGDLVR